MLTCNKMVQEVAIQQVASFQIFIRDNKPKMNVCYPFLSQEQIMSKLRDQWKKLDDSKRQSYSKLVLTKKKTVKTTKVKVVKITRCRTPKVTQTRTVKQVDISRSNNGNDNFGFSNISDESYIDNECELDSTSKNSPFMRNKFAIESRNSSFCPATYKPTESVKKRNGEKTYGGSVFGLRKCVPRVRPESMDNFGTGILQKQCKKRQSIQGHVSFSTVQETVHNHNCYQSSNEDFDEEVLCIESKTEKKTEYRNGNTCSNTTTDVMVPCRINLQQIEDHSPRSGSQHTPALKYNPAVGKLRVADSTKQKLNGKNTVTNITVISSESTPSRFSKRMRKMSPHYIFGTLRGQSLHRDSNVHLNKKPKLAFEYRKNETFPVTNNMPVEKIGRTFCFESPNLSAEVKVQSCIRDSGNVLPDVQGDLHRSHYKNGTFRNFKPEHNINNELKSKADVNRNSLSGQYSTCVSDYRANEPNEFVSSRAITYSHKLPVFDSPQKTKSKRQKNDSSYLKTNAVKISQKITSDFCGKDTYWKNGDRFMVSDEESDTEFGDGSSFYQNDTARKASFEAGKKNFSADQANFKTKIRNKSENGKTNAFIRESNILKRKVDSDEEYDNEFDDNDSCYTDDTDHTGVCQTRKKMNSAIGSYSQKSTVNKWEHLPFDFCAKESDINRKNVNRRGEEKNGEVIGKGSLLKSNIDNNILCFRNKQNTYKTYSKRNTLNEAVQTISYFPRNRIDNHSKDVDNLKEYAEERNEFDNVASYNNYDVKNSPCPKSRDTSRIQDELHPQKENNDYQANKITDPRAVCTNNTTHKSMGVGKGKVLDKYEQLKHGTTKTIKNQVSDKTLVKPKPEMDMADVKRKYSKAENCFLRKCLKSVKKQTGKSKKQHQKKSVITQRSTSLNHAEEHEKNKVKRSPAFTSDYTGKASSILPVSSENEPVHCGSLLNNSSTKQYKHTEEFFGDPTPLGKETPNLDVGKFSSDFSRGSVKGLQRMLFPEEDCRKMSTMDCSNTSNIDCRKSYKMNCRNISTTDCKNTSNTDCGNTSNIDCKNTSNKDCLNTSNTDCRNTSNTVGGNPKMDCKTNYKIDYRHASTMDHRSKSHISLKVEDVCNSDTESETSDNNNSLGSETDEDDEKPQDNFLINMANQTTSALLQAIDRLKSLTPPQMNLTDESVSNVAPSWLSEPRNKDLATVSTQPKLLCSMFQDITHNASRAYLTPAKPRLLASSVIQTPSNFMVMFDDGDVFL